MKSFTIAVICHEFTIDIASGYSVAFEFYKYLSEKFIVKCIYPVSTLMEKKLITHINQNMSIIGIFPSEKLLDIYEVKCKEGYPFYLWQNLENDSMLVQQLKHFTSDADIIISDSHFYIKLIKSVFPQKKAILRSIDIEYDKVCDSAESLLKSGQLAEEIEIAKEETFSFEREAYEKADEIFALTSNDIFRLSELYQIDRKKFTLLPLCVGDLKIYDNKIPMPKKKKQILDCLFIGYANYDNFKVVCRIAEIAQFLPNIRFHIVGKVGLDLPSDLIKENMKIYGEVDNAQKSEIFNLCDCAINISNQTYGMNSKVIDYLAFGLPLLSSKKGVRGYDLIPYQSYYPLEYKTIIDDIKEFEKLSECERQDIALNGYLAVINNFVYSLFSDKIERIIGYSNDMKLSQNNDLFNKKILIFGAGEAGISFLNVIIESGGTCSGFIDSNKQNVKRECLDYPLYSPDEIEELINSGVGDYSVVIAINSDKYAREMYKKALEFVQEDYLHLYFRGQLNPQWIDYEYLKNGKKT